jgi:hypothetical protein
MVRAYYEPNINELQRYWVFGLGRLHHVTL